RLSSIAHDLRTPLTGVLALLDLIEGGADGALQPAQRARLLRVRSEIGRIVSLAEEIADLAVVEAGQLSLATTEIDLAAAVALARREAEPLLRAKAVELTVTMTADIPRVQGDPRRIGQILSALLASAASRAEGATLELIASVSGAMVEVILRESTRAIPIEALPPGFETGSGGSLGSSQTPRERISLAVARGLVELHGGTLSLGAGLSPGTLARFELPIAAVSQRPQTGQNPDLHPSA
ncbi:MAG TPA: HAMP domain-containing sensor histidine kinase, partial [Candidatus Polarisedimenticolia bacterium]|nr:HAMP domain-containing sensor histidine kinase [Candidatus Polarisedimenticolia bacterium]